MDTDTLLQMRQCRDKLLPLRYLRMWLCSQAVSSASGMLMEWLVKAGMGRPNLIQRLRQTLQQVLQAEKLRSLRDLMDALLGLRPVHGKVELIRVALLGFPLQALCAR